MVYKEEIVQIIQATSGLKCIIAFKDKGIRYGYKSLCYALVRTDDPNAEHNTRITTMVMTENGEFHEAKKLPGFIGFTFDPRASGEDVLTKSDIERLEKADGGDPQ